MEVLTLMGPRVLGLAVVQINFVVNIVLTDGMVAGSLVALTTAFTLMFFALGVIAQSVGSAVFPSLAALAAEENYEGFKNRLSNAMRSVLFLAIPATVTLIVLGEPLISIFERGEWTTESTAATAWALSFYATGIVGFALLELLSRAFYALSDTWTPVVIGIGAMIANIIFSLIFIQFIGDPNSLTRGSFAGLALANASTTLVESLVLWWLMRRRIGDKSETSGINDSFIISGAWRVSIASILMGIVMFGVVNLLPNLNGFLVGIIGLMIGSVIFFAASFILRLDEARLIPMMILRKIRR